MKMPRAVTQTISPPYLTKTAIHVSVSHADGKSSLRVTANTTPKMTGFAAGCPKPCAPSACNIRTPFSPDNRTIRWRFSTWKLPDHPARPLRLPQKPRYARMTTRSLISFPKICCLPGCRQPTRPVMRACHGCSGSASSGCSPSRTNCVMLGL